MNKDSKLHRHITLLKTAIKKGLIHESYDWVRIDNPNIHVVEFEIEVDQA